MMKNNKSSFQIINSSNNTIHIVHEPECFELMLLPNDVITIEVDTIENSVLLRYSIENGIGVIGIIPDKSLYKVLQNGVNVFSQYM